MTAGAGSGLTIRPLDAYGNFVTGYQGTATLTSSDGQAVSPSTVTFGASGEPQGQVSVNVTLDEPDQVTLTAAAGSVTGTSAPITVDAATYTATNGGWTGYTSTPGSGVTAVGATWVQPTITGSGNGGASIWVGIDGWNGPTVEQCGVNDSLVNGTPQYFAWYEFFGDESSSGAKGPDYVLSPFLPNTSFSPAIPFPPRCPSSPAEIRANSCSRWPTPRRAGPGRSTRPWSMSLRHARPPNGSSRVPARTLAKSILPGRGRP